MSTPESLKNDAMEDLIYEAQEVAHEAHDGMEEYYADECGLCELLLISQEGELGKVNANIGGIREDLKKIANG